MRGDRWASQNGHYDAKARERSADILIIGGGTGGCAAALAAARSGRTVLLTEETDWIGGQLTQQAVPPDENPWIEQFGASRSYRRFREQVRGYYRRNYPLKGAALRNERLNPGNGSVSRLCHEPRAALAALNDAAAPHISAGRLTILLERRAVSALTDGDRVLAVLTKCQRTGEETVLRGEYVMDATETGELLPMTQTEYVVGAEAQAETDEPHAPSEAQPDNHQAFTVCFAMDFRPGENWTIEKPEEYDFWRAYVPEMRPPWPGRLLSLVGSHPVTLEPRQYEFDPVKETGLWRYRRILDRANFEDGAFSSGISLVNWPMNDYWLGNLIDDPDAETHLRRAKRLSLSLLYWLQTEAPRPDGGEGWQGLRLRGDIVGTKDGLAKYPYIRESRRIRAEFTVTERHVGLEARMAETGARREEAEAAPFHDSVGVGSYRIDLHPSSGGDNYIDISSLPFQIPLGSLLPIRMENLLPACKNIGSTHISNGCYRLHPVEWGIGEAAGLLASHCVGLKETPRAVRNNAARLSDFQRLLDSYGVERSWPRVSAR